MRSILFRDDPNRNDELIADLWALETSGIIEGPEGLRAFFASSPAPIELPARHRDLVLETRDETGPELASFNPSGWDPILVGEKFFVAPSWIEHPVPPGRFRLAIDTAQAFGTGRHESTQLMLQAMENYVKPGHVVADIGCGSGILSLAARLLGAGPVIACDIHAESVAITRETVSAPALVFRGSADALRPSLADVVLANITGWVIDILAYELSRIAKPDGLLLLSGFTDGRAPTKFRPETAVGADDWLCWVCRPQALTPEADRENVPLIHSENWW